MRLKHVFLFLSMVSIAFSAPMEPAKSTLFILLDGMNPSNKGLLQDYCEHYENSEVWGKTGAAKYFQEKVDTASFMAVPTIPNAISQFLKMIWTSWTASPPAPESM